MATCALPFTRFAASRLAIRYHLKFPKITSNKRLKLDINILRSVSTMAYTTEEKGVLGTLEYKLFFRDANGPISPFHDIPLFANEGNKIFNMVVEVPRWTNAKMEIATKDPLNPIKQDMKKGKLRYVANCFPHHGYIWNYGALPQTWENPSHTDADTGLKGDNDPIDVCEIGYRVAKRGEVLQVKEVTTLTWPGGMRVPRNQWPVMSGTSVPGRITQHGEILGALALMDEGETDWKLIAIDVNDPMAPQLSDISDVEQHMPGFLKATVEWFKIYKIPDGKPENQFAFNGEAKDREFAHKILLDTHNQWRALIDGRSDPGELSISCTNFPFATNKISTEDAEKIIKETSESSQAAPLDPKVDLWHFVSLK